MSTFFSWDRFVAMVVKEFIQMRRDRLTFGMMIGIPLIQLTLFGFAINTDPKALPTALIQGDNSPFTRLLVSALHNSQYFDLRYTLSSEAEGRRVIERGDVQFVINIPANFTRDLLRGDRPVLLVEADATDPAATSNALTAVQKIADTAFDRELRGPLASLKLQPGPVELRMHRKYNEEGITQYNVVPALMGVVLTMTMIVITSLAITRERERGTMENLLATPVKPLEVMIGKIVPYVAVGYIQMTIILIAAKLIFHVPMLGSLPLLYCCALFFIGANLSVGITFSTLAQNQLQAMQMSFFFFLPSILLSGFMFPFRGMPGWAQTLGSVLPLTHFLRLVRGILLKGNGPADALLHVWPIALFMLCMLTIAGKRYRRTLD